MSEHSKLVDSVQRGDVAESGKLIRGLLDQGDTPQRIIQEGIVPALDIVGKKFSAGECFIPEMLVAARAAQRGLNVLEPLLAESQHRAMGTVVIGTVQGDLHDIGKNIVAMMLKAAGLEIIDLGVDVAPEAFAEANGKHRPQILAMSCLLTTTMGAMQRTMEVLNAAGMREGVTVMIGGPPVSHAYAETIGADYYGEDAYQGVEIVRELLAGP
jgi:methanogenic corrinoid protein MtbC1